MNVICFLPINIRVLLFSFYLSPFISYQMANNYNNYGKNTGYKPIYPGITINYLE